jgi:hypothetical protein
VLRVDDGTRIVVELMLMVQHRSETVSDIRFLQSGCEVDRRGVYDSQGEISHA